VARADLQTRTALLEQRASDRQAEPRALDVLVAAAAPEPVAGPLELVVAEPRPFVAHGHDALADRHAHRRAGRPELDGVVEHDVERAGDRDRIGDRLDARLALAPERDVLRVRGARPRVDPPLDERHEVDPLGQRSRRVGLRELQEPLEDAGEMAALARRGVDVRVAPGTQRERVEPQQERVQRIAQLVRGVGDQAALALDESLDVRGHLVEGPGEPAQLRRAGAVERAGRHPPGGDLVRGGVELVHGPQDPAGEA
jgi:hypothetical protein